MHDWIDAADMPWNVRVMHVRYPDGHASRISRSLDEPDQSD